MDLSNLERAGRHLALGGIALMLGLALVSPAAAQRTAATNFRVGDKIEVLWAGDAFPGKVVKVERGYVTVNYEWNGRPWTERYAVNSGKVRKIKGAARTVGGGKSAPTRKWKDSTGKFEIEASFADKDDSAVQLKKSDGQTIKIPLAKLSKEDQAYLEGYLASVGGDNPFQPVEEGASDDGSTNEYDREADYSELQIVLPQPIDQQGLTPDAAGPVVAPASNKAVALSTAGRGNDSKFFESPRGLVI
ncbi:MAG: SHD1 domain-containing protein, partial [Pirellulaceae bacterium]